MKVAFIFFISFLSINPLFAQEEINKLTAERESLYRKYKEAESLSTGIFGNRSKDDLQTTIDALNEIIKKDNEILEELKNVQADSKVEFTNKYNDLIQQNNDLSQKNRELLELSERHKGYSKENHDMLQATEDKQILFMSLLTIFVIIAIVYVVKYFVLKSEMKKMMM
jgi:DNA repair exonuclease SbcCD ATPase subunit